MPEKFIVKTATGEVDHEATALKLAREGYIPLEKKLGGGQVAPRAAEDYKVTVPQALVGKLRADQLLANEGFKDFMHKAHAAGLTQAQFDAVSADFLERGAALRTAAVQMDAASCEAELRQAEGWKTDGEYKQQVGLAVNAGRSIFGADFEGLVKDYGNDPRLIRGLAGIGREIEEDRPPSAEATAQLGESLDQLMRSPAYLNAAHAEHAVTLAKVEALTKRMAGSKQVAGGRTISFNT